MSLTFHRNTGMSADIHWYVGQRAPFFPLTSLEEITVDGHELKMLQRSPMPVTLWKDREFLSVRVARSANRDAALVIYGMLLAQIAPHEGK